MSKRFSSRPFPVSTSGPAKRDQTNGGGRSGVTIIVSGTRDDAAPRVSRRNPEALTSALVTHEFGEEILERGARALRVKLDLDLEFYFEMRHHCTSYLKMATPIPTVGAAAFSSPHGDASALLLTASRTMMSCVRSRTTSEVKSRRGEGGRLKTDNDVVCERSRTTSEAESRRGEGGRLKNCLM